MTTFALAPRPPPRDASPECSSSSCDATRPRPPRPGKGPRPGRTHRLASRTKAAPTDGGNDEENENVRATASAQKNSFAKTFPAAKKKTFAPRPPAGAPAKRAFAPEEDVERSALLRAVRDAENESVSPKRTPVTVSLERRKARNGGARRFGAAFDGNAPRTPPPLAETESKKKAFRRATRVAKSGMGRTGGGGGGGGDGFGVLYQQNEDCSPVAPTGVRTRERRERVVAWAPGGSAGVSAWGEFVGKTASPESGSSRESVSRESVSRNSARLEVSRGEGTDERPAFSFSVGQRTARAIDALRSTRRRAWSADASPYAASLSLTGTLPPARGARRSSSSLESRSRGRDSNASANCKAAASVTPPKTLRARLERVTREARDWERKCAEAEVECDALRLETQRKDDAVSVLTRSLAEAEERLNAKIEKQSHGVCLPSSACLPSPSTSKPVPSAGTAAETEKKKKTSGTLRDRRRRNPTRFPSRGRPPRRNSRRSRPSRVPRPWGPWGPWGPWRREPSFGRLPPVASVRWWRIAPRARSSRFSRSVRRRASWTASPRGRPSRTRRPRGRPRGRARRPPRPRGGRARRPRRLRVGGALSEDEDGTDVPGDGPAELRTPPAARRAGEVFERTAEAHPAEAREAAGSMATNVFPSASATPSTPSSSTPQIPSRASPVACASCAAARSRHEASEASCNALREALRATRRERETLESEKASLASRLAAAETDLSDAVASLHFERLDSDGDGKITLDDLLRAELFASYAQPVVERIFEQWTHSRFATTTSAMDDENAHKKKTHIDAESFRALRDWTERKSRSAESSRFWFRVVDVDGDGVLSRHDIKWLYDAVYKDETTCVSLEDLTCQIFDMAGADGSARGDALRGGITCAAVRGSRLADGIFGILCNHDDMLLRRSTAEFSNEHAVPM